MKTVKEIQDIPARTISPSHTHPWPPCESLPSTNCFSIRTRPYPVTILPVGSVPVKPFPYKYHITLYPVTVHIYPHTKMDRQCSEMLAYKIQMLGNYPEEAIQHSEHSRILKSRKISYVV
jgi:hypothetical protein